MQIDIREAAADQRELESETDLRSYTADRQTRPDKSEP
jgi:hypothetical protein